MTSSTAKWLASERVHTLSGVLYLEGWFTMRMIHKSYACHIPNTSFEYTVHAWMAPGANAVNLRVEDKGGFGPVETHKFSYHRPLGQTMDDMIEWLFYVIKA